MAAGAVQIDGKAARPWGLIALAAAVVLGAVFRLGWVGDMEYKGDEKWTFERVRSVGVSEPFPWLGMATSYEVRHPGGTVWVFLALGELFQVREPTDLGTACQALNVAALLLLVFFAFRFVPAEEREPWLWAAALVAVNPLAVVLHRKIWPPSVTPFFVMVMLMCWWRRERRVGAFAWGVAGAVLGQVHPAGLFMAAGFALWAFLFDRKRTQWLPWLGGSALGALTLLPWVYYVLFEYGPGSSQRKLGNALEGRFWTRWATEPFGVSLHYTLSDNFIDFLRYPLFAGRPTYLIGLLHAALAAGAIAVAALGAARLWRQRARWRDLFVGRESQTAFTLSAGLWGFGILFTLTCLPIHRHYMVLTFPLMFLWVSRLALGGRAAAPAERTRGRACLAAVCVAQALISAGFLGYVHSNPRNLGEYGTPYAAQANTAAETEPTAPHE